MALIQVDYFSDSLARGTEFNLLLPNDVNARSVAENKQYKRSMKTLYLLHGYSGTSKDWLMETRIQELSLKYNLAVVMPSGENSFYLDGKGTGKAYCQFVGKELVDYVGRTFGLSTAKEDVFVAGLSMGGFGAIHTGLSFPETFGKIGSFSSALITNKIKDMPVDFQDGHADYDYYTSVFGTLSKIDQSVNSPEFLVRELSKAQKEIPSIYMTCGTEDFLINENRAFHSFLTQEQIAHEYIESAGEHNWIFWNQYLEPAIKWMLEEQ